MSKMPSPKCSGMTGLFNFYFIGGRARSNLELLHANILFPNYWVWLQYPK